MLYRIERVLPSIPFHPRVFTQSLKERFGVSNIEIVLISFWFIGIVSNSFLVRYPTLMRLPRDMRRNYSTAQPIVLFAFVCRYTHSEYSISL